MHISVIVPFHNSEAYIEECIRALLAQNYPKESSELILIDNNSTDRSRDIVLRYVPRVKLLAEPRAGSYAARNRGLAEARGSIIAFTDSDCSPAPDWLQQIHNVMDLHEVGLVQGTTRFATESSGLALFSDYETAKARFILSGTNKEIFYGYTNNMAVRRTVLDRTGPFLELLRGADVVFVHRVIDSYSCDAIRFVPDVRVKHLEITSIWKWFQKLYTYGRSYRLYSKFEKIRALNSKERIRILRNTAGHGRRSALRWVSLILIMLGGVLSYEFGRRLPSRDVTRTVILERTRQRDGRPSSLEDDVVSH